MWILHLLIVTVSCAVARAAQANYTIDDSSPLVEYRAALWARNPVGFNISELNNGTVTFVHPDPNGTPTIALNFSATAVYIFVAYPSGKPVAAPVGFIARIDDFAAGEWTADELAPLNNFLAFSNNTLSNKPHTLLLQLTPGASLYFDYAVVTSDTDPNSASPSIPSVLPAQDASKAKKPPVGAIVGGVVGGLLLIALVLTPLLLRRRAMARRKPETLPSIVPFVIEPPKRSASADQAHKEAALVTPFVLQRPPPPRSATSSEKSALSIRIPSARPPANTKIQSTLSATSPVLTQMAEEMRRITMSVQRLESGIPEAQDGGPLLQRPPAYGNRRE